MPQTLGCMMSTYLGLRRNSAAIPGIARTPFWAIRRPRHYRGIAYTLSSRSIVQSIPAIAPQIEPTLPDDSIISRWTAATAELRSTLPQEFQQEGTCFTKVIDLADSPSLCFYPGRVHGGLLAFILDEAFAEACSPAVTANINLDYRAPLPPGSLVLLRTWIEKVERRKRWVKGKIESLARNADGERTTCVDADGLFIIPRSHLEQPTRDPSYVQSGSRSTMPLTFTTFRQHMFSLVRLTAQEGKRAEIPYSISTRGNEAVTPPRLHQRNKHRSFIRLRDEWRV